jgi:hypothetical protein
MKTKERARVMRADRKSFAEISKELGISLQHAYKCAGDISRRPVAETRNTVVRYFAHNGGCSTQSGMMPVSLPRIVALHGEAG